MMLIDIRRAARRGLAGIAPLLLALTLGGCGDLLEVENPVDILEEDLDDERVIPALSNSAEAAVADAYDMAVQYGELPSDGSIHVSTNQGNLALDRGILGEFNERAEALYNEMAAARWAATEVTRRLEALVADPASNAAVGRSLFWDAIARITLADVVEEVPFDGEAPQTPVQVYEGAIQLLQRSAGISTAAGATDYAAAAYGQMARAHRSLYFEKGGDAAELTRARDAAEQALALNPTFRLDVRYQTPGSSNTLGTSWEVGLFYDVMSPVYANRTDPASGQRDSRIVHGAFSGQVSTFGDSVYQQQKYTSRDSDIRLASWQEARLILAEYYLVNGDLARAREHMNAVRAAAGLPALTGGTAESLREQLIYERASEFWLELRRWQDMRYYDIIPERWDPAMQQAGVDRRFPVSLRERSTNPYYR